MTCACGHIPSEHHTNGRCMGECSDAHYDTTYKGLCPAYTEDKQ